MNKSLRWKNAWPSWLGSAWFGVLMGLRGELVSPYARITVAGFAFGILVMSFSISFARTRRDME